MEPQYKIVAGVGAGPFRTQQKKPKTVLIHLLGMSATTNEAGCIPKAKSKTPGLQRCLSQCTCVGPSTDPIVAINYILYRISTLLLLTPAQIHSPTSSCPVVRIQRRHSVLGNLLASSIIM